MGIKFWRKEFFEISFRERKFLSSSMFRWRFLKKFLMCCFCDEVLLAGAAVLFNSYK